MPESLMGREIKEGSRPGALVTGFSYVPRKNSKTLQTASRKAGIFVCFLSKREKCCKLRKQVAQSWIMGFCFLEGWLGVEVGGGGAEMWYLQCRQCRNDIMISRKGTKDSRALSWERGCPKATHPVSWSWLVSHGSLTLEIKNRERTD